MQLKKTKSKISLEDYKGDLHVHTLDQSEDIKEMVESRIGSNCAVNSMEDVLLYLFHDLKHDYVAITNHSRDSSAKYMGQMLKDWLMEKGISDNEVDEVAKKILFYDDARLKKEKALIELNRRKFPHRKIISGVEVNILTNGKLDTDLVNMGYYEFVVASIHPWLFEGELDAKRYQWMLECAINNRKVNAIAHIGYGCHELVDKLDWDFIARECIANQVAIEINLHGFLNSLEMVLPAKLSTKKFKNNVDELLSNNCFLLNNYVMEKLSNYFDKGLRLMINTDLHRIEFRKRIFYKNNFQYRRLLVCFEKIMNNLFLKYDIERGNIINFLFWDDLQDFISKKYYG